MCIRDRPYSLRIECGFFNFPQLFYNKGCETGPPAYSPYPRRLESLTICWCNYKGSTFCSVILRPWVVNYDRTNKLTTSRMITRCSTDWATGARLNNVAARAHTFWCNVFTYSLPNDDVKFSYLTFWRQRDLAALHLSFVAFFTQNNRKSFKLTQSSILMSRFRCSCRRIILNYLIFLPTFQFHEQNVSISHSLPAPEGKMLEFMLTMI